MVVLLLGMLCFFIWQDNSIVVTRTQYFSPKLPEAFDGFTIVQISDLHNKSFGKGQERLLNSIRESAPDLIVVTGDLIDRRRYNLDVAMAFIEGAVKIAPVYYVSGNHEALSGKYDSIRQRLTKAGVTVLDDAFTGIEKGGGSIRVFGLSDPVFGADGRVAAEHQLSVWSGMEGFKILLSHRPELFAVYAENSMDLIFTGHAHGGQVRLPGIGGLFSPDQGFFPAYTSGSYQLGASTMFVSRGLGNSIFPIRIFNRPQVVVVTLRRGEQSSDAS